MTPAVIFLLFRSPVKTVLTVLLLAAAAFLLLDNLSSYAMQTEAVKQADRAGLEVFVRVLEKALFP